MSLKRPHAIAFNKKNDVRPFDSDSDSTASIEFWASKNDASLFVIGQTTKKRPHGLTFVRMYDGRILDMLEVGVDSWISLAEFKVSRLLLKFCLSVCLFYSNYLKTPKSTPGHKPLLHFASELFDTHTRFIQLKSILISFFNGEEIESLCLPGIQHVISITCAPTPSSLNTTTASPADTLSLPKIHIRTYTLKLLASGVRIPRIELVQMGPSLDLAMRRHIPADPEIFKISLKRPKLKKTDVEKGLGKKVKNTEVDEMGDLRGRLHVAKQNMEKLQTRKMKGLKNGFKDEAEQDSRPLKRRKS
jgi:ribosome production factor 2